MSATALKKVRCAIYTRVSTDAGLDQDFNSLDAQYDAAQAYIRSQAHDDQVEALSGAFARLLMPAGEFSVGFYDF